MGKIKIQSATQRRDRRRARVRARISGTAARPRLNVFRSVRYISAQLIDDSSGVVLASVHSKTLPKTKETGEYTGKVGVSYSVGVALAEKAKIAGITEVVFDRAGYRYHGRVKALAEGARTAGLIF